MPTISNFTKDTYTGTLDVFTKELEIAETIRCKITAITTSSDLQNILQENLLAMLTAENKESLVLHELRFQTFLHNLKNNANQEQIELINQMADQVKLLFSQKEQYLKEISSLKSLRKKSLWIALDVLLIIVGTVIQFAFPYISIAIFVISVADLAFNASDFYSDVRNYFTSYFFKQFSAKQLSPKERTQLEATMPGAKELLVSLIKYGEQQSNQGVRLEQFAKATHMLGFAIAALAIVAFVAPFPGVAILLAVISAVAIAITVAHVGIYFVKMHNLYKSLDNLKTSVNEQILNDKQMIENNAPIADSTIEIVNQEKNSPVHKDAITPLEAEQIVVPLSKTNENKKQQTLDTITEEEEEDDDGDTDTGQEGPHIH